MHFEAIEAVLREFELLIYLLLGMCLFFLHGTRIITFAHALYDRCWYPFIYLCIYICKKRKSLNGTIAISPFKTLGVDFLSNL